MANSKATSSRLYSWVFHLILWTIWIGLPIINAGDNERFFKFALWSIPITLTNIPLFLVNTEWSIPNIFKKRGILAYLFSLILLVISFSVLQYFMKEWIIPEDIRFRRGTIFWTVVPILFVTALSTGYGFITYLINQEKAQEEQQKERMKSELSFLRSQISPHFIFNVLNSIVYLIRAKSDQAEAVTIKLSELMRYMLYNSADEQVVLATEVDYLENYIALQRVRFEEDVTISLKIEGDIGHQRIEPMLMIPFVENAFKHGVGMLTDPIIDIHLVTKGNQLDFSVRNKIAPESKHDKDFSSGIGLKNVSRRLELLYPESHSLNIETKDNWFIVNLNLIFTPNKQDFPHTQDDEKTPMHSS